MWVKICGIKDPETAFFSAVNGADFIGMILTPGYERSVSVAEAKQIAEAVKKGGAHAVGVFVSELPHEIEAICKETGIETVQFYGHDTPLSPHLNRIYVNEPYAALRQGKDHLLIESSKPGSGTKIDPKTFLMPEGKEFFLAGGLCPENVQEMIALYKPIGVDVSTGVEKNRVKDKSLILQFIASVKNV